MTKNTRNIIGLDLGTNSIGWSWIQQLISPTPTQASEYIFDGTPIIRMSGSRIIPMPGDVEALSEAKPSPRPKTEQLSAWLAA